MPYVPHLHRPHVLNCLIGFTVFGVFICQVIAAEHESDGTRLPPAKPSVTPPATASESNPGDAEDALTIGKSSSGNLNFKSGVTYEKNQNADAVKKLEGIRDLRGGTNQWSETARLLQEVLATDASRTIKRNVQQMALLELAGVSERVGQLASAQQLLAEYIERYSTDPIVPEILLRQGYLYRQMGANQMAISKFYLVMRAALMLKGNLAYFERVVLTAKSEIAETNYLDGRYKEAADFYQILLKEGSEELNFEAVKAKLIRSLAKSGNHSEVVKQANEFLSAYGGSDNSAEIRYLLAAAHKASGDKQQALQQLLLLLEAVEVADAEKAAKWKAWKMLAGNEIGNQLFLEGGFTHAVQVYRGLLALDESPTWKLPILYQIGLCFERVDQPDEAAKSYDEIIGLGQKGDAKLDEHLQMIVGMARFRHEILTWKKSLERNAIPTEQKIENKTN